MPYYVDYYGNTYSWDSKKQSDGKFHAQIYNIRSKKPRVRTFAKRKSAKKWCLHNCRIAKMKQKIAIPKAEKSQKERQIKRNASKPDFYLSPLEKKIQTANKKIKHYKQLQAKIDTKIKSLTTRKKTYNKKITYYTKRIEKLKEKK